MRLRAIRGGAEVSRWIEAQRKLFPKCPMVVTARFAGYVRDAVLGHSELTAIARALSGSRDSRVSRSLVRRSGDYARRGHRVFIATRVAALVLNWPKAWSRRSKFYELATNPLMLQIIALVHRDRGKLPDRRVDLYEECVNVLLDYWDRAKKGIDLPFTAKEALRVLQPVAYWMHQEPERRFASKVELMPRIDGELRRLRNSKLTAEEFLDLVRDRSGLLVGYGTDEYGFAHLSFQEFLTAKEIRNRADYSELISNYGEAWWREVTRLLVALEDPSCFEPFFRELVGSERFAANHSLTSQCLMDASEPSVRPFSEALEVSLGESAQQQEGHDIEYQLLQAMSELSDDDLEQAMGVLGEARTEAASAQARALAQKMLAEAGHREFEVELDEGSGLPESKINEVDGSELVLVPGGKFIVGDNDELLPLASFYLVRTPVTNQHYSEFLKANHGYRQPEYWDDERFNQPQQPVVGVSWDDAAQYCKWAGLRLPTEWEWGSGCARYGRPIVSMG